MYLILIMAFLSRYKKAKNCVLYQPLSCKKFTCEDHHNHTKRCHPTIKDANFDQQRLIWYAFYPEGLVY